ncbi:MAG: endonuclease/exonuclease/phosphatase family protein [Deltaproteobacteria bacterium]|nr:endonuclease/exonuclease/phosphatase family protein [Deltaproteobacteria bacterium]
MTADISSQSSGNLLFRVLSYNIHRGIGFSRRKNIARIAAIIRDINPDIVALQEVENIPTGSPDSEQLAFLAAQTGLKAIPGPTLLSRKGDYGNAVLSRVPVQEVRRHDISYSGKEPRGLIDIELAPDWGHLRILATHLGLKADERRYQANLLESILSGSKTKPVILMGDMNEWMPTGRSTRFLQNFFGRSPFLRTFPALLPIFALDRIFVSPNNIMLNLQTVTSFQARIASDHLPILATIKISPHKNTI